MELFVARNGQQTGPYDEARVRDMLARGEVSPGDLAWHSGLSGWQPLSTLFPAAQPAPAATPPSPMFPPQSGAGGGVLPAPMMMPPGGPGMYGGGPGYGGALAPLPAGQTLANPGARLGAILLDVLIGMVLYIPAVLLTALGGQRPNGELSAMGGLGLMITGVLGLALIAVQIYLISTTGQSIGKKIVGVRIVRLDGSLPGFVYGFLMRSVVALLPACIPFVGGIYGIVDACFIFRQDRRCIHDIIAGTRVINA